MYTLLITGIMVIAVAAALVATRVVLVTTSDRPPRGAIQLPVICRDKTGTSSLHTYIELSSGADSAGFSWCRRCVTNIWDALVVAVWDGLFLESRRLLVQDPLQLLQSATITPNGQSVKNPEKILVSLRRVGLPTGQGGQNEPDDQDDRDDQNDQSDQDRKDSQKQVVHKDPVAAIKACLDDLPAEDQVLVLDYVSVRPQLIDMIMSDNIIITLTICRAPMRDAYVRSSIKRVK